MLKGRHILDNSKQQIEQKLQTLTSRVMEALQQAVACLKSGDQAACNAIIEGDALVNATWREIEQDCFMLIARHQPVAHDLREIVACTRIADELERMGDYAADIASMIVQMDKPDLADVGVDDVTELFGLCTRMLDTVLAAYRERDAELAREAAKMDDAIDAAHARMVEKLFAVMQADPARVPNGSRMLWISHNLERCGDRATNIAEQVVFLLDAAVPALD